MTLAIVKSNRVPGWARPVQRWTTKTLLLRFGLALLVSDVASDSRSVLAKHRKNPYDLWDELREQWKMRRKIHPDAPGGNEQEFKWLSAIYSELKIRMRRKGVVQ